MKYRWFAMCFALLFACSSKVHEPAENDAAWPPIPATDPAFNDGKKYIAALVEELRLADRIVITEHSNQYDLPDPAKMVSLMPKDVVYATITLRDEQKRAFVRLLEGLDPATQNAFAACIFEPHHTISFYRGNAVKSELAVCFACSDIRWPGAEASPPWSMYGGLKQFIGSLGMHLSQDWAAAARAHLARAQENR